MIEKDTSQFIWAQKFRPRKIDDCILPDSMKKVFKDYVAQGQLPNFLLTSPNPGTGKTTVAMALCEEIGAEYILINGSEESGIDTLRTKVMGFATTVSLTDSKKVIIIDEADGLNPNSFQPALRATMEATSGNCRFILTANHKNKIIEPIHSRCTVIDFKIPAEERPLIAAKFMKRVVEILKSENVEYDPKVVAALVQKKFPDFRSILNDMQKYAVGGRIDSGILADSTDESYGALINHLKAKEFTEVRKWVGKNSDTDTTALFRMFYDKAYALMEPSSIPQLILILADYGYKSAFSVDQEVNMMAALTEIMSSCKFKE